MLNFIIVDELDAETVSIDSSMAVEKLQGCFDELKQKLQTVKITSDNLTPTTSNPTLHQPKEISRDKEEMLNSITSDVNDSGITFKSAESGHSTNKPIGSQRLRSLPRIYNLRTNPSVDHQDEDVWR